MKSRIVFSLCLLFCLPTQGQDRIQSQINELKDDVASIIRVNRAQAQRITELEQQVTALNALNGNSANFQQLIGTSVVPVGTIMPYYGDLDALPSNWMLCNGSYIEDSGSPLYRESRRSGRPIAKVPNLNEYFVRGTTDPAEVNEPGGQNEISGHSHSIPSHRHEVGNHTHDFTTNSSGFDSNTHCENPNYGIECFENNPDTQYFLAAPTRSTYERFTMHQHSGTTGNASTGYTDYSGTLSSSNAGAHDNRPRFRSFYYIIKIRDFERPYLGLRCRELNSRIAAELGISQTQGIDITEVISGSAAATAGLRVHDIIIKVDNIFTIEDSTFDSEIAKHQIGDRVQLTIVRNGSEQIITATLGARPRTRP